MKSKLLALLFLIASPILAGGHFSIGIGIGRPYYGGGYGYYGRPPIVTYAPPPVYYAPRPYYGYGPSYYGPNYYGSNYGYDGSYGAAPYPGAIWVAPRYYGGRHYRGYWRHR